MSDFIDKYHSHPATFDGESWFIQNILNYNKKASKFLIHKQHNDNVPDSFGIAVGGFGAPDWFSSHEGGAKPCAKKYLSVLTNELIQAINSSKTKLIIDMSIEGYDMSTAEPFISALHQEMSRIGLRASSCNFLSQNFNFSAEYTNFCEKKGVDDRIKIHEYDYCPRKFVAQEAMDKDDAKTELEIRLYKSSLSRSLPQHFLCLNFTPRPARVGFVSWLFGKGLNERGMISFRGVGQRKDGVYQAEIDAPDWFPQQDFVKAGNSRLNAENLNLDLDSELSDALAKEPVFSSASDVLYRETGFSLVTETDVHDGGILRITEKSLKPIAKLHPFMILGNPGSLKILKSLGFKTFSPMIDESYDSIHNANQRILSIMDEFERIVELPQLQFDEWRCNVAEEVIFNYEHFRNKLPEIYCDKELDILNAIWS